MTCNRIQEWILTDYVDGMLPPERIRTVDDHAVVCLECRELLMRTKALAVAMGEAPDPALDRERVWLKVADEVTVEKEMDAAPSLWEWLLSWNGLSGFPRPALWAGATLVLLIMIATYPMVTSRQAETEDRAAPYLAYVMDEIGSFTDDGEGQYDTAIEQYFL